MSKLTVIGAASVDNIRVPGKVIERCFGGAASYSSMAASFFTNVDIISNIGQDYPAEFLETFNKHNVNTQYLNKLPGKTAHFDVEYDAELYQETYHAFDLNVAAEKLILPANIQDNKYVYLAATDPDIQLEFIEQLNIDTQIVGCDTHAIWIDQKRDSVEEVMRHVDVMFANDNEVRKFGGHQRLKNCAKEILKLGVDKLIVKMGGHGAILFHENTMYPAIAYGTMDMPIVDPTGCGDSLAGGFMGMMAANDSFEEKLRNIAIKSLAFGSIVASFNIMDFSVNKQLAITVDDIWRRYDRYRDLIRL